MEDILDVIMDYYMSRRGDVVNMDETEEEEFFYKKIIFSVREYDREVGNELENIYSDAVGAVDRRSFRNGFKSGIHFLLECMNSN